MKFKLIFYGFALFLMCSCVALHAQIINTIAGNGTPGFGGDGSPATSASCEIDGPACIVMDAAGNKYFTDANNNRIRKISVGGTITTIAGTGVAGDGGDGGLAATAAVDNPIGLAIDASGNLYFTTGNNAVRKINMTTGVISHIAGVYTFSGYTGDGGQATAAELWQPEGVAVDASGNLLIADTWNNVIRKVDVVSGIITTVYGNSTLGGYSGDGGPALGARLLGPVGLFFDASWNLFFCDESNNVVREINTLGTINTVAGYTPGGGGLGTYGGDGGPVLMAGMNRPTSVVIDGAGNMYIADHFDNIIREVSGGIINTIAGVPVAGGYTGDGIMATDAELNNPWGLLLDAAGNLNICDGGNSRIRKISPGTVAPIVITGDTTICYGATTPLTASVTGGSWFSSNSFVASVDMSSGVVNGVAPGTSTISYFAGGSSATVTMTVIDCTTTITISGDTAICIHGTSALTASLTGGTWSSSNTAIATVNSSGVVGGVSAGSAVINYTATTGIANQTVTVRNCHTAGVTAAPVENNVLKVYPNPNSGLFSIFVPSSAQENGTAVLTNVVGEKLMEFNIITNSQTNVNMQQPPGIYFISVSTTSGRYLAKVIVE